MSTLKQETFLCNSRVAIRFLGIALLNTPNELTWYWGNLVVYVNSYRFVHNAATSYTPWFLSIFITSWALAVILAAQLCKKLQRLTVLLIGVIIYNVGMFSSYFAIQSPVYILDFTLGVWCGFGYGLIQALVYVYVKDLAPRRTGLAIGMVSNCLSVGAMLLNEITTGFLNPDNEEAEIRGGFSKVFVQKSVVDPIPYLFLILGSVTTSIHVLGLSLLACQKCTPSVGAGSENTLTKTSTEKLDATHTETPVDIPQDEEKHQFAKSDHVIEDSIKDNRQQYACSENEKVLNFVKANGLQEFCDPVSSTSSSSLSQTQPEDKCNEGTREKVKLLMKIIHHRSHPDQLPLQCAQREYTLQQALRTRSFYLLCLTLMSADLCYMVLLNFYKLFGQETVSDDHFLKDVGTVNSLAVLLSRLVMGHLIDRFGLKNAAIAFSAGNALVFGTYYVMARVNRWILAAWTICQGVLCSGFYILFPVAALRMFGPTHFTLNYGAIMSTTVLTNTVAPVVLDTLLDRCGWFGLYFVVSLFNLILLVGLIAGLSNRNVDG